MKASEDSQLDPEDVYIRYMGELTHTDLAAAAGVPAKEDNDIVRVVICMTREQSRRLLAARAQGLLRLQAEGAGNVAPAGLRARHRLGAFRGRAVQASPAQPARPTHHRSVSVRSTTSASVAPGSASS